MTAAMRRLCEMDREPLERCGTCGARLNERLPSGWCAEPCPSCLGERCFWCIDSHTGAEPECVETVAKGEAA